MLLYSAVLTRGCAAVEGDQGFDVQPLITLPFGHANQALLNLCLTGAATPNVWDGVQDAGGMLLPGVTRQAQIGYLTIIEALRYCNVGSFFKCPSTPLWVLASETHFTLLFSLDRRLVAGEVGHCVPPSVPPRAVLRHPPTRASAPRLTVDRLPTTTTTQIRWTPWHASVGPLTLDRPHTLPHPSRTVAATDAAKACGAGV